jgi:Tfp pilus assembly protein PilE
VKQKKNQSKEGKLENDKINSLVKKLYSIENKPANASDDKKCMTTFYKNIYNRFPMKIDSEANCSFTDQKLNVHHSQPRIKKSF